MERGGVISQNERLTFLPLLSLPERLSNLRITTPSRRTAMHSLNGRRILFVKTVITTLALITLGLSVSVARAQNGSTMDVNQRLAGFDAFMEKTLKDWNAPG